MASLFPASRASAMARRGVHPLHGLLLAVPVTLFPAALLADITYLNSAEMQWSNIAAWAITFALLCGGLALLWGLVDALRRRGTLLSPLLLALAWGVGLVNAFHHSRDAWSSVGTAGLLLSLISSGAAVAAGWIAFGGGLGRREMAR
ncbi:membrane protein [Sphingomonas metalli]|uniref:Membrane protein n=1 Tax=Sphingomonas metalli TaxID=1779358 RepID=A0A916TB72_9SPHN|nr:DUF2231 domain-containing protein [Sphingomonas metalli]GGB38255.1 membrane protein [Sphingomonas metalli]